MPKFARYIGIDYSGAGLATDRLPGLRAYVAEGDASPVEARPATPPGRHWSRRDLAEWLRDRLLEPGPTVVGIDHGFSFPEEYFARHGLTRDWPAFLDDFHGHWPTDEDGVSVQSVREGRHGGGLERRGDATWLRLTEHWTATAKSVFLFDVQGAVSKSTHAGLPWLRFLRRELGPRLHFWPFDGWDVPAGRSLVAEVYPSLWMRRWPREDRDGDQHAAFAACAWLQRSDHTAALPTFLHPALTAAERDLARYEGWILGAI